MERESAQDRKVRQRALRMAQEKELLKRERDAALRMISQLAMKIENLEYRLNRAQELKVQAEEAASRAIARMAEKL